jgi:hypothetical protein
VTSRDRATKPPELGAGLARVSSPGRHLTEGLRPHVRLGDFGRSGGKVGRPCHSALIADELNAHKSQCKLDATIVAAVLATAAQVINHYGLTVSGSDWEYLVLFAYSYI